MACSLQLVLAFALCQSHFTSTMKLAMKAMKSIKAMRAMKAEAMKKGVKARAMKATAMKKPAMPAAPVPASVRSQNCCNESKDNSYESDE